MNGKREHSPEYVPMAESTAGIAIASSMETGVTTLATLGRRRDWSVEGCHGDWISGSVAYADPDAKSLSFALFVKSPKLTPRKNQDTTNTGL
jgi:hypothetical protein